MMVATEIETVVFLGFVRIDKAEGPSGLPGVLQEGLRAIL
jgi:hypothetical protein